MTIHTMALFGEAERGEYKTPYFLETLPQLVDYFGNPPPESRGLFYAVQALMFNRKLIFFRVEQEGFSSSDYHFGLKLLSQTRNFDKISAICTPGVGNAEIINATVPICEIYHSILILTEADFYDYVMEM